MTVEEALKMIADGESLTVELKAQLSSNQERDVCKEVAALATMQGGHLFIGVGDDGKICGLVESGKTIQKMESWIAKWISPAPTVNFNMMNLAGIPVLRVHIRKGLAPVYYYDGRPYMRVGTQSAVANPAQVEYLVGIGELVSEMRATAARIASREKTLHPSMHVAAGIIGQGELSTMSYETVRDRLFDDLSKLLPSLRDRLKSSRDR